MNADEFMVTLPSNASASYYPNNGPNSFKIVLPQTLYLEGDWEMAIIGIQYPFNWPNFTEENLAVVSKFINDTSDSYTKTSNETCDTWKNEYKLDKGMKELESKVEEYIREEQLDQINYRVLKMPTGYYSGIKEFGEYFSSQFNSYPDIAILNESGSSNTSCKLTPVYNPITKTIKFLKENISSFQILSFKKDFAQCIGFETQLWNDQLFVAQADTITQKAHLNNQNSMNVYCDIIKYQIVGDTQAPLLATLPVHGNPNEEFYWPFFPPYYISLNQNNISSIEIKICTESGDPFPFDKSGRVVCKLHFKRHRPLW